MQMTMAMHKNINLDLYVCDLKKPTFLVQPGVFVLFFLTHKCRAYSTRFDK